MTKKVFFSERFLSCKKNLFITSRKNILCQEKKIVAVKKKKNVFLASENIFVGDDSSSSKMEGY